MSHAMLLGCYTTIKVAIFLHASSLQLNLVNCSAYARSQPLKPKGHALSWRDQSGTYSLCPQVSFLSLRCRTRCPPSPRTRWLPLPAADSVLRLITPLVNSFSQRSQTARCVSDPRPHAASAIPDRRLIVYTGFLLL